MQRYIESNESIVLDSDKIYCKNGTGKSGRGELVPDNKNYRVLQMYFISVLLIKC